MPAYQVPKRLGLEILFSFFDFYAYKIGFEIQKAGNPDLVSRASISSRSDKGRSAL
jgi:hypothetical protein